MQIVRLVCVVCHQCSSYRRMLLRVRGVECAQPCRRPERKLKRHESTRATMFSRTTGYIFRMARLLLAPKQMGKDRSAPTLELIDHAGAEEITQGGTRK